MEWKEFNNESCPNCGDGIKVFTDCIEEDDNEFETWFSDGDRAECSGDCGFKSVISVSEDDEAWVQDGNILELPEN